MRSYRIVGQASRGGCVGSCSGASLARGTQISYIIAAAFASQVARANQGSDADRRKGGWRAP